METPIKTGKPFRVASVSSNTNSFGLHGHILIAQDGEAWQAAANNINMKVKGDVLVLDTTKTGCFATHGFEIPERLPDAPEGVVAEIWQ